MNTPATCLLTAVKGQTLTLKNYGFSDDSPNKFETVTVSRVTKTRIYLVEDERVFLKADGDVYGDQDDWSTVRVSGI